MIIFLVDSEWRNPEEEGCQQLLLSLPPPITRFRRHFFGGLLFHVSVVILHNPQSGWWKPSGSGRSGAVPSPQDGSGSRSRKRDGRSCSHASTWRIEWGVKEDSRRKLSSKDPRQVRLEQRFHHLVSVWQNAWETGGKENL